MRVCIWIGLTFEACELKEKFTREFNERFDTKCARWLEMAKTARKKL
jgi:hypothetical protein